jgi:hypothetical protein
MKVHGNNSWPTIRFLREELSDIEGPPIAYGMTRENTFGGTKKYYGHEQLKRLNEAGVNVPEFTNDYTTARRWRDEGYTLLGRNHNHTQGKDIKLIRPIRKSFIRLAREKDYWVKLIRSNGANVQATGGEELTVHEWRVHIFRKPQGYRTIGVGVKIQAAPPPPRVINRGLEFVRARRNGWHMRLDVPAPKDLRPLARRAVEALEYDFGAVDILDCGIDNDPRFVVLEVNAAPALRSKHIQQRYLNNFKEFRELDNEEEV